MKIVLAGLTGLGNAALRGLVRAGFPPMLVIGRREAAPFPHFPEEPLSETCAAAGIEYAVYESLDSEGEVDRRMEGADLLLVASFHRILPAELLGRFRAGAVNFHPSLLPRYRGPTPLFWILRQGDRVAGITGHHLTTSIDAGPILARYRIEVPLNETCGGLLKRLSMLLQERIGALVGSWAGAGRVPPGEPQDEAFSDYFRRLNGSDRRVSLANEPERAFNHIRALLPAPGPLVNLDGEDRAVIGARLRCDGGSVAVGLAGGGFRTVRDETGRLEVFAAPPQGQSA